eukprot:gene14038-biopygen6994
MVCLEHSKASGRTECLECLGQLQHCIHFNDGSKRSTPGGSTLRDPAPPQHDDSTAARQHGSTAARQHGSTAARQHDKGARGGRARAMRDPLASAVELTMTAFASPGECVPFPSYHYPLPARSAQPSGRPSWGHERARAEAKTGIRLTIEDPSGSD